MFAYAKSIYNNYKAISYCRVSSKNQIYGISLDVQKQRNADYAKSNNLLVVENISEVIPGYGPLKYKCQQILNGVSHLIISDVSRFNRSIPLGMDNIKFILDNNIVVHFIKENLVLTKKNMLSNDNQFLKFREALYMAEEESKTISERICGSKRYKYERGEHRGGLVSYGLIKYKTNYNCNDDTINTYVKTVGRYRINEHEFNVLKFIQLCKSNYYTANDLNELMSLITGVECDEIELCNDGNKTFNTEPLNNGKIAKLLNDYYVEYKGKHFTSDIVYRLHSIDYILDKVKEETPGEYFQTPETEQHNNELDFLYRANMERIKNALESGINNAEYDDNDYYFSDGYCSSDSYTSTNAGDFEVLKRKLPKKQTSEKMVDEPTRKSTRTKTPTNIFSFDKFKEPIPKKMICQIEFKEPIPKKVMYQDEVKEPIPKKVMYQDEVKEPIPKKVMYQDEVKDNTSNNDSILTNSSLNLNFNKLNVLSEFDDDEEDILRELLLKKYRLSRLSK